MTKLRKAIKKAEITANELRCRLQTIGTHLIFSGFEEDDEPIVSIGGGDEIFIVYKGSEISIDNVIFLMENHGFITKDDFIL